jgi:hypothetical protein
MCSMLDGDQSQIQCDTMCELVDYELEQNYSQSWNAADNSVKSSIAGIYMEIANAQPS